MEQELTQAQRVWHEHLQRIDRESMTISAYSRREGVSAQSLYAMRGWLKSRSAVRRVQSDASRELFTTVTVRDAADAPAGCVLVLGNGVQLRLLQPPDPSWLGAVLRELSERPR